MNQVIRIKTLMLRQGVTVSGLARELGVPLNYITRVVDGSRRFPRVRAHLAQRLGYPVEELFPIQSGRGRNRKTTKDTNKNEGHE